MNIIEELSKLEKKFQSEAKAYLKMANIKEGSSPMEVTPDKQGYICSAGTYQLCAKDLRQLMEKLQKEQLV